MSVLVLVPLDERAETNKATPPPPLPRRPIIGRIVAGSVPYLVLMPALITLVIWVYRPLMQTFQLSVYDWNLLPTTPKRYVGADNYSDIIGLPDLWKSVRVTIVMMLGLVPFTLLLPVVAALVTQRLGEGWQRFYRAAVFVPVLITPVVTAAVWRWLLNTSGGVYQRPLQIVGLEPVNWFRAENTALLAVIVIAGWKMLGFATLMVTAGLSNIDASYIQAAQVDGASPRRIVAKVTIPLLSPTLTFMGLMTVLLTAQWMFPLIQLLTLGGPSGATTNIYYLLWKMGFSSFDVGLSSAAGVLFFVVFGVVAIGCLRLMDRWSFYEGQK